MSPRHAVNVVNPLTNLCEIPQQFLYSINILYVYRCPLMIKFKNLQLGKKFTLLLVLVFLGGVLA
ncbi:MAG: hypothetical protein AAF892_19015, partial [Cyanobacteria bacterium P01_D01_bin.71]